MKYNIKMSKIFFIVVYFFCFERILPFYQNISVDLYSSPCGFECVNKQAHELYKSFTNRLFKMWTGLDFLQSLQTAIPEDDTTHYWLLVDAVRVLYDLKNDDKNTLLSHPSEILSLAHLIKNILDHPVVAHTSNLKMVMSMCNTAIQNILSLL